MTITATAPISSSSSASATPSAPPATPTLSYNSFLSLLTTELQNQDPTQPMDPTQMVTQLATISQVGQSVQTNSTLSSMLTMNSLAQAEQLIGKKITSADGATSGVVASVTVTGSGSIATLIGGAKVFLGNGIRVSG
jgi:flagellar basal-body rod modification protein FlgD